MPDYSTLHRSSSRVPSAHSESQQRSIRHRSGAYQSSVSSPNPLTTVASRHIVAPDFPRAPDARVEQSNSHAPATAVTATTPSQSNGSHFTAIPARSRRSSIVSSSSGLHRPSLFPATSTITTKTRIDDNDDGDSFSFTVTAPLDVRNDTIALLTRNPPTTPSPLATFSKPYFFQVTANVRHLAKHMSSLAHSALSSLRQKGRSFSFPNPRNLSLPTSFDSNNRQLSSKNSSVLEQGLTPADKLTHKWPRPRSSRSGAPWLRSTNPFLPRSLRELRGAGGWSQGHMEAVLRDSRGLGINWVGQWTLHKWCLLASVTIVFLLGLTCLVFSLLTWFAGKSTTYTLFGAFLISPQFDSFPRSAYSPHYGSSRSRLAHIQLFSPFARFDGGNHWDTLELSPHSRGLRAPSLPIVHFLRLCRLSYLQESELFPRCKSQRSVAPLVLS